MWRLMLTILAFLSSQQEERELILSTVRSNNKTNKQTKIKYTNLQS